MNTPESAPSLTTGSVADDLMFIALLDKHADTWIFSGDDELPPLVAYIDALLAARSPAHVPVDRNADCSTGLIAILEILRPNYGDVGSRDVDVTAKRTLIDRAIGILKQDAPATVVATQEQPICFAYLPNEQRWVVIASDEEIDGERVLCIAIEVAPPQSLAASAVPDAWIQFIDGVKTQNLARNDEELDDIKKMFRIMRHPGKAEYVPLFFAAPAVAQPAVQTGPFTLDQRMPPKDVEVLIYWPCTDGKFEVRVDEWSDLHEDPIGMGGPTICVGEGWVSYGDENVTHWAPIAAPSQQPAGSPTGEAK